MRTSSRIIFFLLIVSLFLAGCAGLFKCRKNYEHFWGNVMSQDGKPLESARVEINGAPIRTDAKGRFSVLVKKSERYVMNIRKPGWGMVSRVFDGPTKGGRWSMPKATTKMVDPTQLIFVQDTKSCLGPLSSRVNWNNYPRQKLPRIMDSNGQMAVGQYPPELEEAVKIVEAGADCPPGISIQIPANSLVNMAGNAPEDKVQVSVSTVDLFTPGEMPGDWTVLDENGKTMYMRSTGAGIVEITAKGRPYQLKKGTKAVLTIPIDPTQLKKKEKPDPTIPLLIYDEKNGVWRIRGKGKLNEKGDAYVAEINHLTPFNMDVVKTDPSCVVFRNLGINDDFKLEVTIPGTTPRVKNIPGYDPDDEDHVLFNLPNNTNIQMRPFRGETPEDNPLGTYLANTGPQHAGSSPPVPGNCYGSPVWDLYEILLEYDNLTHNSVTLQWNCVPGVWEYHLQNLIVTGGSGPFPPIGSGPENLTPEAVECGIPPDPDDATYTKSLDPSTNYEYQVIGQFHPPGNLVKSNEVEFTTPAAPTPIPPTGLQAMATSSESIKLTWNDAATNEANYRVRRSASASGPFEDIGAEALSENTEEYHDYDLDAATTYYYNVQAYNTGVDSGDSIASATTSYNIVGTWSGPGTEHWSNCSVAGTYPIDVVITIDQQTAVPLLEHDTFTATGVVTSTDPRIPAGAWSEFDTFNGHLNPDGRIELGEFTSTDHVPGEVNTTGSGSFDGTVNNNGTSITLNFDGSDDPGDDPCTISGTFTVNR